MRFYHHPFSSNSRRARMVAIHLGIQLDEAVVDLAKGEQRAPGFLKLNPNGRVPVLVDGDFVLTESHAIIAYLADKTPGQSLYPTELRPRADVNRWLFWSAQHFGPAVGVLNFERVVKGFIGAKADPHEEARGERLVPEVGRVLDAHLAGKEWVAEGRLTLADFALAAPLMARKPARLPLDGMPNLDAWFARVQGLDAWKRTAL